MKKLLSFFRYFTIAERLLWFCSWVLILVAFVVFDRENYVNLISSLVGTVSLIFCAKGNPAGPFLMVLFCLFYGIISLTYAYYGETITYLGMSLPMAVVALVSWLRNPYKGNKAEVTVNDVSKKDILVILLLSVGVTVLFYFILKALYTANLLLSTFSVTTSFIAAALSYKRSPYYAIAYAANDIVLIGLWALATLSDISYLSVTLCFSLFLVHDLYGYYNWTKMKKRQSS